MQIQPLAPAQHQTIATLHNAIAALQAQQRAAMGQISLAEYAEACEADTDGEAMEDYTFFIADHNDQLVQIGFLNGEQDEEIWVWDSNGNETLLFDWVPNTTTIYYE